MSYKYIAYEHTGSPCTGRGMFMTPVHDHNIKLFNDELDLSAWARETRWLENWVVFELTTGKNLLVKDTRLVECEKTVYTLFGEET